MQQTWRFTQTSTMRGPFQWLSLSPKFLAICLCYYHLILRSSVFQVENKFHYSAFHKVLLRLLAKLPEVHCLQEGPQKFYPLFQFVVFFRYREQLCGGFSVLSFGHCFNAMGKVWDQLNLKHLIFPCRLRQCEPSARIIQEEHFFKLLS